MKDDDLNDGKPDPEKAAKALAEARKYVELNTVVDLVVARLRDQKERQRRWSIGLAVAIGGTVSALLGVVVAIYGEILTDTLQGVQREIEGTRFAEERRAASGTVPQFNDQLILTPGQSRFMNVPQDDSVQVQLLAAPGSYRVDVVAVGEDSFDPVVSLYRYGDGGPPQEIDFNDDGGENRNARLRVTIESDADYYLDIGEFVGNPGDFVVSFEAFEEE